MSYAGVHQRALATVKRKGAPVTFTSAGGGTYDPLTDRTTGVSAIAVRGYAVRAKGNPLRYQALELIPSEAPTLFFVPSVYGAEPSLGSHVVFGGVPYVVRDVEPVAPDGTVVGASVIVSGGGPQS